MSSRRAPSTSPLGRRDFLKLAGLLPLSLALPPSVRTFRPSLAAEDRKNVLVIVFDAFSAYHVSVYGYARQTTPNIARLAERAIVYHNHYSGGNFTTPGTASLMTGTLPWTHRAFRLNGTVENRFVQRNLFAAFPNHFRIAYSHNPIVNVLLKQFAHALDDYVPLSRLLLISDPLVHDVLGNDEDIADVGWIRAVKKDVDGYSYSLFLSNLYDLYVQSKIATVTPLFPRGIPRIRGDNYFTLNEAIDWLVKQTGRLPEPYLGYFHFMPPHAPYTPEKTFYRHFSGDQYVPPVKPGGIFDFNLPESDLVRKRAEYDEYVLNLDREFGRLFDSLDRSGRLKNTWLVLTADHGELFERGFRGHGGPLMYQGAVRVPLMIFEPGRTSRTDIRSLTSAEDVLPTLVELAGGASTDWAEGTPLPPFFGDHADPGRSLYVVQASETPPAGAIKRGSIALVKDNYKLIYYLGYAELSGKEHFELYDIQNDPEELQDLYQSQQATGDVLLGELKAKLAAANVPYS